MLELESCAPTAFTRSGENAWLCEGKAQTSREETMADELMRSMQARFDFYDKDGDGRLSAEEVLQVLGDEDDGVDPEEISAVVESLGSVSWVRRPRWGGDPGKFSECYDLMTATHAFEGGQAEAMEAEAVLVTFMREVVLPLAAETRAVILVNALRGQCLLSGAFMEAFELEQAPR